MTGPLSKCAMVDSCKGPAPTHALIGRCATPAAMSYSSASRTGPRSIGPRTATPPDSSSVKASLPSVRERAGCSSFSCPKPPMRSNQYQKKAPIPIA